VDGTRAIGGLEIALHDVERFPGRGLVEAPRRLDEVGDGSHPDAPVDVHGVVDEALREVIDAPHLDVAVGGPLGDPEPAGVRREGEGARRAKRGHAAELDVL